MDGAVHHIDRVARRADRAAHHDDLLSERRLRLSAERMLDHVRGELLSAHRSLSEHVERVSAQYMQEREARLRLTGRSDRVVAERRAAETRADRLDRRLWHAVEAIRDGFAIWDADGTLVQANPTYVRIFDGAIEPSPGTPYETLLRAAAEEGVVDTGAEEAEAWVAAMLERRAADTAEPVLLHLYDGRAVRLQDRWTEDGDVVSLAVDVTAEVEREAALTRARMEAEAANKAKSRFLARMSHEFRTPMNGVIGMSDLLLEGEMDDEARLYVQTIRDSGLSLLDIVNDVLDAARLEAGQMTLRPAPFDLEQTLMQVVRLAGASGGAGGERGARLPAGRADAVRGRRGADPAGDHQPCGQRGQVRVRRRRHGARPRHPARRGRCRAPVRRGERHRPRHPPRAARLRLRGVRAPGGRPGRGRGAGPRDRARPGAADGRRPATAGR